MADENKNSERYSLGDALPDDPPRTIRVLEIGGSIVVIVILLCALGYTLSFPLPTGDAAPPATPAAQPASE